MKEVIDILDPREIMKVAGAGNKFVHLAEGLSEFYINLVPGIKMWDLCASEAIIKSRLGIVTNING